MTLQACADIVRKGDPDRFLAAMAAPVSARRILFPIYAFNVEVARAPWVTQEPMIAEMRLQWWRDVLEEIAEKRDVRKHEVTTELATILSVQAAKLLDDLVSARRWDIYSDAFEDQGHFDEYLVNTGGKLTVAVARLLAPELSDRQSDVVSRFGAAAALARFLQAVPALEANGRIPLVDGRTDAVRSLAEQALKQLPSVSELPRAVRPALLEGWQTKVLLNQVVRNPARVSGGEIGLSEFNKRMRLVAASF